MKMPRYFCTKTYMTMKNLITLSLLLIMTSCSNGRLLKQALDSAGSNRSELETVLKHYSGHPDKLAAARFLIENMPAHHSYMPGVIDGYYNYAGRILADTALSPEQQRDSLLAISDSLYSVLPQCTIPDAQIIKSEYLIADIDRSYELWTTCPWSGHITFPEYLEWLLPYKACQYQELDAWPDSMLTYFGSGLEHPVRNDVEYNTVNGISDMLRREALEKSHRYGLYTRSGLPLLSAHLITHRTFGNIPDYALMTVLLMRSAGIPAVLDHTPVGPRYTAATTWFVILDDRCQEQTSEWDLSTNIGWGFFPYERGPKVYRSTYAIDRRCQEYLKKAKFRYPFDPATTDVTEKYFMTSDLAVPIRPEIRKTLADKYVYIESALKDSSWQIVDFGTMKKGNALFNRMGREVMYRIEGFDGNSLVPVSNPFILHKDGSLEYISPDSANSASFDRWKNNPI